MSGLLHSVTRTVRGVVAAFKGGDQVELADTEVIRVRADSTGHNPAQSGVDFVFTRVGKQVNMRWTGFSVGATVGGGFFDFGNIIPVGMRPMAQTTFVVETTEGGSATQGGLIVNTAGLVRFGGTSAGDTFNGATSNGVSTGAVTWSID